MTFWGHEEERDSRTETVKEGKPTRHVSRFLFLAACMTLQHRASGLASYVQIERHAWLSLRVWNHSVTSERGLKWTVFPAMKLRSVKILVSGWSKWGPRGLFRVATTDTPTCKHLSGGQRAVQWRGEDWQLTTHSIYQCFFWGEPEWAPQLRGERIRCLYICVVRHCCRTGRTMPTHTALIDHRFFCWLHTFQSDAIILWHAMRLFN